MAVTVRYLGQLRRVAGVARETLDVSGTVADLLHAVNERHPTTLLGSALVFVNDEQAEAGVALPAGATVTLLTPIAGGSQ